jgi:peptide/nickel transport system substrate-binding protein
MWRRRTVLTSASAAVAASLLPPGPAAAAPEKVLRVAMTVADIPLTSGQPSQGGEGQRFIGYQLYDALINWDLSKRDVLAKLRPGLALSWSVDAATQTVWTFKLRPGVKFHDGSPFNAAAVVFNFDKLSNKDSPAFDTAQATQGAQYVAPIKSYRAIDDLTLELTAKRADAVIPYQMANIFISSPANWEKLGRDWNKVALTPSGRITGTRRAFRRPTARSCCPCRTPTPALRRCSPARSTGSKRRRRTRSTGSNRPACRSS